MSDPLTPAEFRALQALARYESSRDAASALGVSEQTVKNEAQLAYRKLGVKNRTAAFRALGWLRAPHMTARMKMRSRRVRV